MDIVPEGGTIGVYVIRSVEVHYFGRSESVSYYCGYNVSHLLDQCISVFNVPAEMRHRLQLLDSDGEVLTPTDRMPIHGYKGRITMQCIKEAHPSLYSSHI